MNATIPELTELYHTWILPYLNCTIPKSPFRRMLCEWRDHHVTSWCARARRKHGCGRADGDGGPAVSDEGESKWFCLDIYLIFHIFLLIYSWKLITIFGEFSIFSVNRPSYTNNRYFNGSLPFWAGLVIESENALQANFIRILYVISKVDCVRNTTPVFHQHHWLPIEQRTEFKILLLTYKSNNHFAPAYLSELIPSLPSARTLRYFSRSLGTIPLTTSAYDDRAFSVSAPKLLYSPRGH